MQVLSEVKVSLLPVQEHQLYAGATYITYIFLLSNEWYLMNVFEELYSLINEHEACRLTNDLIQTAIDHSN